MPRSHLSAESLRLLARLTPQIQREGEKMNDWGLLLRRKIKILGCLAASKYDHKYSCLAYLSAMGGCCLAVGCRPIKEYVGPRIHSLDTFGPMRPHRVDPTNWSKGLYESSESHAFFEISAYPWFRPVAPNVPYYRLDEQVTPGLVSRRNSYGAPAHDRSYGLWTRSVEIKQPQCRRLTN
jgi:hypothetical protein